MNLLIWQMNSYDEKNQLKRLVSAVGDNMKENEMNRIEKVICYHSITTFFQNYWMTYSNRAQAPTYKVTRSHYVSLWRVLGKLTEQLCPPSSIFKYKTIVVGINILN